MHKLIGLDGVLRASQDDNNCFVGRTLNPLAYPDDAVLHSILHAIIKNVHEDLTNQLGSRRHPVLRDTIIKVDFDQLCFADFLKEHCSFNYYLWKDDSPKPSFRDRVRPLREKGEIPHQSDALFNLSPGSRE